jgi:Xaa-Pro aminopeptidase
MSNLNDLTALDEIARTRAEMYAAGIDIAVVSSIANATYVTGMEVPVPVGAGAELTFAPWLALVSADTVALVAPAGAGEPATKNGYELFGFDGFDSFNPTDPGRTYVAQLTAALKRAEAASGERMIGVETRSLPLVAARAIEDALPGRQIVDVEDAFRRARSIKTTREIALLRRASHIADVAHNTLAELCREAGLTEFEMFAEISRRVFSAAGRDIPLTGELVTGPRTTTVQYPAGPRDRTIEPGDAALMDLSGRIDGYWFDCTNTHVIAAEPTKEQLRFARASQAACEAGMDALRPGNRASDAAAAAAKAFASFDLPVAHYAGHQIGVTVNELPRLVPYDDTPIEPGMVFSVEPGAYQGPGGSFGARSEKMVLVTESGPEILSTFSWGI